jgi:hypothetical protein
MGIPNAHMWFAIVQVDRLRQGMSVGEDRTFGTRGACRRIIEESETRRREEIKEAG